MKHLRNHLNTISTKSAYATVINYGDHLLNSANFPVTNCFLNIYLESYYKSILNSFKTIHILLISVSQFIIRMIHD